MESSLAEKLFRIIGISCRIGRDGELAPIEQFVCHLYGTPEQQTVDNARLQLFGKGKLGLEMLPPTRYALELHTARANYQAKADRPGAYKHPFSHRHICMNDGVRLLESCMDKTASHSRCVPRAGHLWMQG